MVKSRGYIIKSDEEYFVGHQSELFTETVCFAHVFPYSEDLAKLKRLSKTLNGSLKELNVLINREENHTGSVCTTVEYVLISK